MSDTKPTSLEEKWAAQVGQAPEDTVNGEVDPEPGPQAELEAEIAELKDKLLRSQAEMVNFRRRAERARVERGESARADVLRQLLPVVDDFERAAGADTDNVEAYREGVALILRTLVDALERLGVSRLEPLGEVFDPNLHEAVERQETTEVAMGHVSEVYKPGFMLGDRLLRPAMVAVAIGPAELEGAEGGEPAGD